MKERPIIFSDPMVRAILSGTKTQTRRVVKRYERGHPHLKAWRDRCPYGQPGDRLWVREAHYIIGEHREVFFRATQDSNNSPTLSWPGPWRPSIHMPRWASRITLEVTGVRAERLREISHDDALAEGVAQIVRDALPVQQCGEYDAIEADATELFAQLWERINGAGSWDENPWVWVIEFERTTSTKEAP